MRTENHSVWGDLSLPESSMPSLSLGQDMVIMAKGSGTENVNVNTNAPHLVAKTSHIGIMVK